jgi:hypothetical protein
MVSAFSTDGRSSNWHETDRKKRDSEARRMDRPPRDTGPLTDEDLAEIGAAIGRWSRFGGEVPIIGGRW